jgi:hypothetical protein
MIGPRPASVGEVRKNFARSPVDRELRKADILAGVSHAEYPAERRNVFVCDFVRGPDFSLFVRHVIALVVS